MSGYGRVLALLSATVLAVSAISLAGCGGATEAETTEERAQIKTTEDLRSGDKIGVLSGSTGEMWAKGNLTQKGVKFVPYDDMNAALGALQGGEVRGVIGDMPICLDLARDPSRGIEVVQEIKTDEIYGFAFNKNNPVLRDSVNWALDEVIKDGTYDRIFEKWFKTTPSSMPKSSWTAKPGGAPKTLAAGRIIVGSGMASPPFENVEDGTTVGFDIDLVHAIGKRLGLEVEFRAYDADALITGLQAGGEFDMVASAVPITDAARQSIDFSDGYITSNQSLMVKKGE